MNTPLDPEFDPTPSTSDVELGASVGVWTLVWTLIAMKFLTIAIVVLAARRAEAGTLFAVMTWHWLVVLGALLAAPVMFRYRLRKVRARRDALLRAEWTDEEARPARVSVRARRSGMLRHDLRPR